MKTQKPSQYGKKPSISAPALVEGQVKIFSFDIFDTSITRLLIHPDHLHWVVGARLVKDGLISMDPDEWRALRIDVEAELRKRSWPQEIRIEEIYQALGSRLSWPAASVRQIQAQELACEQEIVRPIPSTYSRIQSLIDNGQTPIFISDTYLNSVTISNLMSCCGYNIEHANIFASSQYRTTKASGKLFHDVIRVRCISPEYLIHFGDNIQSDFNAAIDAGVTSNVFIDIQPSRYEKILFEKGGGNFISSVVAGTARLGRLSATGDALNKTVISTSCNVAAPMLIAFVSWIIIDANKRGINRIYFLARDGQVISKIAKIIIGWLGTDISCHYLLASRQAFYLASLPKNEMELRERLLADGNKKVASDLLTELEFKPDEITKIISRIARPLRDKPMSRALMVELCGWIMKDPWFSLLQERSAFRHAGLKAYLNNESFFNPGTLAIVDLGWKGNLQRRLEAVVAAEYPNGLQGYYFNITSPDKGLLSRTRRFAPNTPLHADLLEAFCAADHASVRGFTPKTGGRGEPLLQEPGLTEDERNRVMTQQEAIERVAQHLFSYLDPSWDTLEQLCTAMTESSLQAFNQFVRFPRVDEAEAYGTLMHAEGVLHMTYQPIAPRLTSAQLLSAFVLRRIRSRWLQGSLVRSRATIAGFALYLTMRARQRFERFKTRVTQ